MRYTLYLFLPFLCGLSQAQTKIDLRSQSKEVDFSTANATRPLKVGPVLPPTCMIGEIFFHSTAAPGSNIYGCVAADTWIRQGTGSGTGSGSGTIETKIDGVPVGSRAIMNMVSGQGMVNILSDDGIQINVQHAIDSSFVETRPLLQSGTTLLCTSLDGAPSNYTCSMTPSLREYVPGMVIHWRPDVDGAGGLTTLNIDNAGTQIIKLIDGRDPSPADIIAGYQYDLWFDGTTFRMKAPLGMAISAAIPPCTIAERARLWLTPGSIGVKDTVSICAKDASDTYSWRPLY